MAAERLCGFAAIDKPPGASSARVVAMVKRSCGGARCGHTGTLDPAATGLLVVAIGPATRLIRFLPAGKRYFVGLRFGIGTDTLDMEGKIVARARVPPDLPGRLAAVLPGFTGELLQKAPAHSALKHKGRPLYDYARRGLQVPAKVRRVLVHEIKIAREPAGDEAFLDVCCGPGTYMRSLARDIGLKVGCPAVISSLVRTECNGLALSAARPPPALADAPPRLIGVRSMLAPLPSAELCGDGARNFQCGGAVRHAMAAAVAVLTLGPGGSVLGVARAADGVLRPLRILAASHEQRGESASA